MGTSIIYVGQVIVTVECTKFASLIEPPQQQAWLCVNALLREKLGGAFVREALDRRSHVCSLYVCMCVYVSVCMCICVKQRREKESKIEDSAADGREDAEERRRAEVLSKLH